MEIEKVCMSIRYVIFKIVTLQKIRKNEDEYNN